MKENEKIRDILKDHCGKATAISSKQISRMMGFPMEDTQAVSRAVIWDTAEEYGLPLLSCNKGYFIAKNDDEIAEFDDNYNKRINGMRRTQEMVHENYKRWKK